MVQLPRIAVGTVQSDVVTQPMVWALAEAFRREGVRVQGFLSRAHFPPQIGHEGVAGPSLRHLDSWLMSPEVCRALLIHGARSADLAVVEGKFRPVAEEDGGGQLEPLCRWLGLPRVVVLDVARLHECLLPKIPRHTAGLLLDGICGADDLGRLTTNLESVLGVPVLGALEKIPALREAIRKVPQGQRVPSGLCRRLGDRFARWWKPAKILELAARRELRGLDSAWLRGARGPRCKLNVAIAYDEAFNCYFPAALDLLELGGASVIGFSPLRDEHLPPQTDVVVFGGGHPERYAATLSENHCMMAALRSHLCAGRRIYGEGGGAAYLCRQMETPGGQFKRMAGIVPAAARLLRRPATPKPVELTLDAPTWLGGAGTRLRGYRSANWELAALDGSTPAMSAEIPRPLLIGDFQSIGSLIHLDFAADPYCLARLFHPQRSDAAQWEPSATVSRWV